MKDDSESIWSLYLEGMVTYRDPSEGYELYKEYNSPDDVVSAVNSFIKKRGVRLGNTGLAELNELLSDIGDIEGVAITDYLKKVKIDHRLKDKEDVFVYEIPLTTKTGKIIDIEINYIIYPPAKGDVDFSKSSDWLETLEWWVRSSQRKPVYILKIKVN